MSLDLIQESKLVDIRILLLFLPVLVEPLQDPNVHKDVALSPDFRLAIHVVSPRVNYRPVSVARLVKSQFNETSATQSVFAAALFFACSPADGEVKNNDTEPCESVLAKDDVQRKTFMSARCSDPEVARDVSPKGFFDILDMLTNILETCNKSEFNELYNLFYAELHKLHPDRIIPEDMTRLPAFLKCQQLVQVIYPHRICMIDGAHRLTLLLKDDSNLAFDIQGHQIRLYYSNIQQSENHRKNRNVSKIPVWLRLYAAQSSLKTEEFRLKCLEASNHHIENEKQVVPGEEIHK